MPPTCCRPGVVRPAAVVNADIRREVDGARIERRSMDPDRRWELLVEWAEARRAEEMTEAA